MATERRWQFALFKRVLANMFAGALLTALIGALCGALTGAMVQWILSSASASVGVPNPFDDFLDIIISTGAGGFGLGGFIGALIFAIAAFRAQPGRTFAPLRALAGRVTVGQVAGTVGFCSLFLAVEGARSIALGQSFYMTANDHIVIGPFWGAPILMICGAVAGALSVCGQQPRREA